MFYHIADYDNRGTNECPFGRIYLSTSKKGDIVGSIGYGAHRDDLDPYAVWATRDTPELGRDHTLGKRAKDFLKEKFPEAKLAD